MAVKEVELNIPSGLKDKPFFYDIVCRFEVIPKIVEASFSTEMGWAIVHLEGDPQEIERLLEWLRKNNVDVKEL